MKQIRFRMFLPINIPNPVLYTLRVLFQAGVPIDQITITVLP